MKEHEAKVHLLVDTISKKVKNETDWKASLTGNNQLLEIVEELLNEICNAYTENIDK